MLGLLAFSGCPKQPPSPPKVQSPREIEALTPEVRRISEAVEALLQTQDELVWKNWTEGAPLDIDQTYRGNEWLFTPEAIHKVERLRQLSKDPREIRALSALHSYLVGEHLAASLASIDNAIANLEASLTFTIDAKEGGREYPFRDLDRLLANERSATRRRALYEAATADVERLNDSLRRREERLDSELHALGYASYEAYGAELRQANLERLGLLSEEILQATQKPFSTVMGKLSQKELGVPLDQLTRADLPRLFRPVQVDNHFAKDQLLPRAFATFKGLGIDVQQLPNVHVDARELPQKNPRSLTVAVKVPADIRVSVKPASGEREQSSVLHELGHAMHFAFTTEPRFELAKLGNSTVAEAFASLFEDLMRDPLWLEEQTGLSGDKLEQYLSASSAHQLFLIRRAAGRILYGLQIHRPGAPAPVADAKQLYSELMARTYGLPSSPKDAARYLVNQEDFFQSADNFRAWFLAGQLQAQLKARFGPTWWHDPKAGDFLKFLWAKGNALTATEIARLAGEDGIKPDVLLLRLGSALHVPISLPAVELEPSKPRSDAAPIGGPDAAVVPASPVVPASAAAPASAVIPAPAVDGGGDVAPTTASVDAPNAPSEASSLGADAGVTPDPALGGAAR